VGKKEGGLKLDVGGWVGRKWKGQEGGGVVCGTKLINLKEGRLGWL